MNFEILGYPINANFINAIEIIILYVLIFFFIKYILLGSINIQIKLLICTFILTVIILESLNTSINYHNIFIVRYKNIIYLTFLLIFFSVFQPELRHLVLKIFNPSKNNKTNANLQNNILAMLYPLKKNKIGALLVIQSSISIEPYMTSYVELDSKISPEILQSIFSKTSILHDGAVIISNGRIKYAKVFFKFMDSDIKDTSIGARHRAAIYISSQTDAEVYVISEERGTISYCKNGILKEIN